MIFTMQGLGISAGFALEEQGDGTRRGPLGP